MKLIKKLALDYIKSQMGHGDAGILVNANNDLVERGCIKSYQAGFRACREMAIALELENSDHRYIKESLEQLGEDEVS